ncbi:sulfatase [Microbacterium sp. HD4P20]|uniref:sulfatase family protein n=1 Tax=Microbacterium sp. HD4P20 TaxID=2864874 RepID=UPI0020A55970|nr:sulfatase [Microbacterium sp. HD4P20]MCP2636006.1 sulfatase [Microbacterium sp. HD4P20]
MNAAPIPDARRPNVLVILADEWRAHNVGYAGDDQVRTPNIDRLAAESINYTQAISGEPICCPARASFLTGQYPLQHGVYINDVELKPDGLTIAQVFRDHGYRTGYIGKWHLYGSPEGRFERREAFIPLAARLGFEFWKALECTHDYNRSAYYADDDPTKRYWDGYDAFGQTDAALEYIAEDTPKPFFLMLSYGPPHFPLQTAPDRFRALYEDAEIRLPENVPDWAREEATRDLRGYFAHIAALDECVGRLLDDVDLDNTVVVFSSDHGDMLWSQGLEHKLVPWEESVRVPLLIRTPDRSAATSAQLFNSPDLMPTLLGFAGLPIPASVSGTDLSMPETGPRTAFLSAPAAYSSLRRSGMEEYRGVRDVRFTYVRTISGPWLLYDNLEDPFQMVNRCGDPAYADEQSRLETELMSWLDALGDEFLPGDVYLRRDGLEHYFEVNEPLGFSGTEQWNSTNERGRYFTIDTALSEIAAHGAARDLVRSVAPPWMEFDTPLAMRRSIRIVAMSTDSHLTAARLKDLDDRLLSLGPRSQDPRTSIALPAWPPSERLTPLTDL